MTKYRHFTDQQIEMELACFHALKVKATSDSLSLRYLREELELRRFAQALIERVKAHHRGVK